MRIQERLALNDPISSRVQVNNKLATAFYDTRRIQQDDAGKLHNNFGVSFKII